MAAENISLSEANCTCLSTYLRIYLLSTYLHI